MIAADIEDLDDETASPIVRRFLDNPLVTEGVALNAEPVRKVSGLVYTTEKQVAVEPRKQWVSVNLRGLMGGFCRFHGTEAQQRACSRLKSLHERKELGGAQAVDPSLEPVDGGGINPEANIQIGADARREYASVASLLGKQDMARIEFVVIHERGPTPYAVWRGFSDGGRGISRGMVEVRGIADRLAEHWQFQSRRAA